MNLIKINLLPYREIEAQNKKKAFERLLILGALVGLALAALVYFSLSSAISLQNGRNESLEAGIQQLDNELKEIKGLQERKRQFLARKQKIEELDIKRFEGARILDTLDQVVPEGTHLTSLSVSEKDKKGHNGSVENRSYVLSGRAVSNNKVALLMTALPSTGVFDQPELLSIKKGTEAQEFSLNAKLVEQKAPSSGDETATNVAESGEGSAK